MEELAWQSQEELCHVYTSVQQGQSLVRLGGTSCLVTSETPKPLLQV